MQSSPALSPDGKVVYVGSKDKSLYAICCVVSRHVNGDALLEHVQPTTQQRVGQVRVLRLHRLYPPAKDLLERILRQLKRGVVPGVECHRHVTGPIDVQPVGGWSRLVGTYHLGVAPAALRTNRERLSACVVTEAGRPRRAQRLGNAMV